MSLFDFLHLKVFHKERAQAVMEKLLRDEFIYQLKRDNTLTIQSVNDSKIITSAITMDNKRNSLIVSEKSPNGILILERNDPVTVVTQTNEDHEVFSFHSKVSNIILDNGDILYEIIIPKRLEKGQRRKDFRVDIDSLFTVKINDSVYEGQVDNLSTNGILFSLDGYWPESIDEDEASIPCQIDMNFIQLDCHVNVRYINFEPYPSRCTHIGGKIEHLQPHQRHQLDNYLTAQQRIQQRRKAELKYG